MVAAPGEVDDGNRVVGEAVMLCKKSNNEPRFLDAFGMK